MRENPELAAKYQLTALHNGAPIDPAALAREADTLRSMGNFYTGSDPMNPRIGYLPFNSTRLYCRFFYDAGLTKTLVPASDIMTDQFIAFANDFDHKAWIAEAKRMR
jgi:hypothetical protein